VSCDKVCLNLWPNEKNRLAWHSTNLKISRLVHILQVDFNSIWQLDYNLQCKCAKLAHIIIVQMMIDNAKLHSITIYKHEMDLKFNALTFKVGKCMTRTFNFF